MRRREFITLVGGAAVAWPLRVRAQQSGIPLIGYLSSETPDSDVGRIAGVRAGLAEAGYVEDQNITIESRWAGNQVDRLPGLVADLIRHQVLVIAASGVFSAFAAKAATHTVPIVFTVASDGVELGLVASLNRPGGNLTGVNSIAGEVAGKGLEVLHELLPSTSSVAFLANPSNPITELVTRDVLAAARAMGLEIQLLHASTEGEIDADFARLAEARTGALLVSNDYFFNSRPDQLVVLAARHAIPTVYALREFALAGGLITYGISNAEVYRLAGNQVARILKGEKPADLPVIQLTKIEMVLNLKTARALGLTMPPQLLARADEVIE